MLPVWLGSLIVFTYGIIIGSFLNVCIYRLPEEQSVVRPPSRCGNCGTQLGILDLVPLFSFLFLGRKCRYCKTPISWQYFTVELITGIVFVLTYLRHGFSIEFFAFAAFLAALIVAFVVDMRLFIIPDEVSIAGVVIGIGKDIAHYFSGTLDWVRVPLPFSDFTLSLPPSVAGCVVCGGVFFAIAFVSFYIYRPKDEAEQEDYEGAMGIGDVKLAAAIGAVVGLAPAMVSFLIAIVLGTIVGVGFIIFMRNKSDEDDEDVSWRTAIPFGPYMVVGAASVMLIYPQLASLWEMWIRLVAPA